MCAARFLMNRSATGGAIQTIIGGAKALIEKRKKHHVMQTVTNEREGLKVQKELELGGAVTLDAATIEKAISAIESINSGFSPIDDAERKQLADAAKKLKMDPEVLENIRHIVISGHIASKVSDVIKQSDEIVADSKNGKTIMQIATERGLPPVSVARQLLLARGSSIKEIRSMFDGETPLPDDLAKQVEEAKAHDHGSKNSMQEIKAHANEFEKKIAAWLKKNKVTFKTEEDLKAEQIADPRFGRPIATPDFFFPEPIKINGELVNWLDVKNYPMFKTDNALVGNRMIKHMGYQAVKYNRHFGRGAFLFNGGVMSGVTLETEKGPVDVGILSGSP